MKKKKKTREMTRMTTAAINRAKKLKWTGRARGFCETIKEKGN